MTNKKTHPIREISAHIGGFHRKDPPSAHFAFVSAMMSIGVACSATLRSVRNASRHILIKEVEHDLFRYGESFTHYNDHGTAEDCIDNAVCISPGILGLYVRGMRSS